MQIKQNDINRFWDKVARSNKKGKCWGWAGAKDGNGYGIFLLAGKQLKAHRVSYSIWNGEDSKQVGHTCSNRWCVNPDHLVGDGSHHKKYHHGKGKKKDEV